MQAALRELEEFGAQPGRAAIFRETSAQHFDVSSGDYDDAVRRDPLMVLSRPNMTLMDEDLPVSVRQRWTGPSMCKRIDNSHAGGTITKGWRNVQLRTLLHEMGLRHVHIQPFEALTAERWDYHSSTKWSVAKDQWISDCTHFCYSPSFWGLSFHTLYETLVQGRLWLQHRHTHITHLAASAHTSTREPAPSTVEAP